MSCAYSEKIVLYYYGETDEAQTKEIKDHLNSCVECKKELEILSGVSEHLDASKVQPPEHLVEDIIRQARKEEAPAFNIGNILGNIRNHWKVSASTLVFAALMVGLFLPRGIEEVNLSWTSSIDSELDGLEYTMYEERDFAFGEYGESDEDFEYEDIDSELENEDRRVLL